MMSLLQKLKACVGSDVEIATKQLDEISGVLTEVGEDYICIVTNSNKEITSVAVGQDGTKETQQHIEVFSLETFLHISEICAVCRVLKRQSM